MCFPVQLFLSTFFCILQARRMDLFSCIHFICAVFYLENMVEPRVTPVYENPRDGFRYLSSTYQGLSSYHLHKLLVSATKWLRPYLPTFVIIITQRLALPKYVVHWAHGWGSVRFKSCWNVIVLTWKRTIHRHLAIHRDLSHDKERSIGTHMTRNSKQAPIMRLSRTINGCQGFTLEKEVD